MGPCMCGDIMCSSCGPAQGYDPKFEALRGKLYDRIPALLDGIVDPIYYENLLEYISEKVADILADQERIAEDNLAAELFEDEQFRKEFLS